MVVDARIAHLISLASDGHVVKIVAGHNLGSEKTKVKVLSDSKPNVVPSHFRHITITMLEALRLAAGSFVVVDRGHRHTSGLSEAHFWLRQPIQSPGDIGAADCSSTAVPASLPALEAEAGQTLQTNRAEDRREDPRAPPPEPQPEQAIAQVDGVAAFVAGLQQGLVRHQEEVLNKLDKVFGSTMTDTESLACSKLRHAQRWDDQVRRFFEDLINAGSLLRRLHEWLGPDLLARVCEVQRPPSSSSPG